MKRFMSTFRASCGVLLISLLLLGGIYPLLVFGVAQTLFNHRANGSLIERGNRVVGSSLLGQSFESDRYFWGRLSATTPVYNAASSGGSNYSPANPKLLEAANARIAALQKADPDNKLRIPIELITASGSGLDPHISLLAANYQLPRVARARGLKETQVKALLDKYAEKPGFGLLGEPYINVLRMNMALDEK